MSKLQIVVGGQFGSEAKGHVVQRLTERAQDEGDGLPQILRVAGPNAGHTGYDASGRAWPLRQVPVAAVTDGPAVLGIAAGSEIDPPVLLDELNRLRDAGLLVNKIVWVSEEATVIEDRHKEREGMAALVDKIGSTGKGIGAARADRLMRTANRVVDLPWLMTELSSLGVAFADAGHKPMIYDTTIIEGTQGYGLGLHAGYYPQCTSSDCRAIDFASMAGTNPWEYDEVEPWVVARMFPIRVAGNSGPLNNETTWEALGLPEERTTVTHKVRRVGMPDWHLVGAAVRANGQPGEVNLAITMVDQMFPEMRDHTLANANFDVMRETASYLRVIERETGGKVRLITTGPDCAQFIDLDA